MDIRITISGFPEIENKAMEKALEVVNRLDWESILQECHPLTPFKAVVGKVTASIAGQNIRSDVGVK